MPHLWKDDIYVVTLDELVPDWYNCESSLYSEIQNYKDLPYGIKRVQLGGHGRRMLIDFDSLRKEIQEGIGDPRKKDHPLERFYSRDPEAVKFYSDFQYISDKSYLLPHALEQYITNASVMQAVLKLRTAREQDRIAKGGKRRGIDQTLLEDAISFNNILEKKHGTSHNLPTSYRHFKTAMKKFQQMGYVGLIKDAEGRSKKNAQKTNEFIMQLLNDLFAGQDHKPTATEVARQYKAFLEGELEIYSSKADGEAYDPDGLPELSLSTITNYLADWDSTIGTHAKRSGDRQKLMQKFEPYHSLSQPTFAGSLLSIDDRQPPFEYEKGKRIWFYNGIDLASEAFTCWVYGKTKDGIIMEFYRQLVRNYHDWGINLPDGLECESSLNSSFKDTFLAEGNMFQNVRIEANNARGKRIEAYYRPLRYQLEKEREGWLARPFALSEANQASSKPKQIIPYNDIVQGSLEDLMTWNNMEHSKIKGKTRWEVFLESQNPNLKPTNYRSFLPYIGHHTQTSCNAGITQLQNSEWLLGDNAEIYTGEDLVRLMKKVEGKTFDTYWLDGNNGEVIKALVYMDGRYICELLKKPVYARAKIERTDADEEARNLMIRYAKTIQGYQKLKKNQLTPLTVVDHRKKTLNDKFQIPGLKNTKTERPTEFQQKAIQPHEDFEYDYNELPKLATGSGWRSAFNH